MSSGQDNIFLEKSNKRAGWVKQACYFLKIVDYVGLKFEKQYLFTLETEVIARENNNSSLSKCKISWFWQEIFIFGKLICDNSGRFCQNS